MQANFVQSARNIENLRFGHMKNLIENIATATNWIAPHSKYKPEIGLILGSGLGTVGEEIEEADIFPYAEIPGFLQSTVEGHAGRLMIGRLQGRAVLVLQGRFHRFEGYSMQQLTLPVRVIRGLGIETLIITNASGAINENYRPGEILLMTDHLNLMADNPLMGSNCDAWGTRFPDMSDAFSGRLRDKVKSIAAAEGIELQEGVYAGLAGPSFETPAEIRALRVLGADTVGFSAVLEVITAVHCGLQVLGLSCLTNMGAGMQDYPLTHQETLDTAAGACQKLIYLLKAIIS